MASVYNFLDLQFSPEFSDDFQMEHRSLHQFLRICAVDEGALQHQQNLFYPIQADDHYSSTLQVSLNFRSL